MIRFLVFADLHYKKGMYAVKVQDLKQILKRAADQKVELVLHAGDFCNDYAGSGELVKAYLNNEYDLPVYGVFGNHELESDHNSMASVAPCLTNDPGVKANWKGEQTGYYFFDRKGFRFICLDTNYSYEPKSGCWQHNATASWGAPAGNLHPDSLGPAQLAWLEAVLEEAAERKLRCILVSHAGFMDAWRHSPDTGAVQALIARANALRPGTVILCINGHYHTNHLKQRSGVVYFDVNAAINGSWVPKKEHHYRPEHTFALTSYDAQGEPLQTQTVPLTKLWQSVNTHYFRDPLSAVVTIHEDGSIEVEGSETGWLYDVEPDSPLEGIMPRISSMRRERFEMIQAYATQNYQKMLRQPQGQLKHPFIVPGSVYGQQLWDWDSWLTNVALRQFVQEDITAYERGCVINFLEHIDAQGRIPLQITPNSILPGGLHDPNRKSNMHKPCLAQHAAFLIRNAGGDGEWLRAYFPDLLRFVDCYRASFRHENGLYYWHDDAAIGVDNDPCTFYRPADSSASIYLNCLMYKELEAVCYIGKLLGVDVSDYEAEREHLKQSVRTHCYDEKDGMYYSVDLNLLPVTDKLLHRGAPRHWDCLIQRIGCWSGFLAMWSGIATQEQAQRMVQENLLDEKAFWAPYGVRTLSKYEKMYTVKASGNPSCWLGPIWGVSNYLVFRGLVKYGFHREATALAEKTLALFEKDLAHSGQLHEYYDPESGEPIINPGFQNWNLLSLNMGAWLRGEEVVEEF